MAPPGVRQVEKFLKDHLTEHISLADVAKKFSYSPAYLDLPFKKEYNLGIIECLIYLKMCRAATLLVSSPLRIKEICRHCGYEDPYYFSRLFKNTFGMSPRQYRNSFVKLSHIFTWHF